MRTCYDEVREFCEEGLVQLPDGNHGHDSTGELLEWYFFFGGGGPSYDKEIDGRLCAVKGAV